MRLSRLSAVAGVVSLALGLGGLAVARAWYNDDACTIEQYQCTLGTIGFSGAFLLIPLGALLLVLAGLVTVLIRARRTRAAHDELSS